MGGRRAADLKRIEDVVRLVFESEQSRMRRLMEREEDLQERLSGLQVRAESPQVGAGIDPATLAGADLRWQLWAEERRRDINQSLARLRVEQAQARTDLARAFGRSEAVRQLVQGKRKR